MSLAEALAADRAGDYEAAVNLYEDVFHTGQSSLDVLIDAAVLCWRATDFGIVAANHFSMEFVNHADRLGRQLLHKAEGSFPNNPESIFWKKYIAWIDLGEPFEPSDCEDLLRRFPHYREPVMFLFSTSRGNEYAREATDLFEQYRAVHTTRARYVKSVIGAVKAKG